MGPGWGVEGRCGGLWCAEVGMPALDRVPSPPHPQEEGQAGAAAGTAFSVLQHPDPRTRILLDVGFICQLTPHTVPEAQANPAPPLCHAELSGGCSKLGPPGKTLLWVASRGRSLGLRLALPLAVAGP